MNYGSRIRCLRRDNKTFPVTSRTVFHQRWFACSLFLVLRGACFPLCGACISNLSHLSQLKNVGFEIDRCINLVYCVWIWEPVVKLTYGVWVWNQACKEYILRMFTVEAIELVFGHIKRQMHPLKYFSPEFHATHTHALTSHVREAFFLVPVNSRSPKWTGGRAPKKTKKNVKPYGNAAPERSKNRQTKP